MKKQFIKILCYLVVLGVIFSCENIFSNLSSTEKEVTSNEEPSSEEPSSEEPSNEEPSNEEPIPTMINLSVDDSYTDGYINEGEKNWYIVNVTSGNEYTISWLDKWSSSTYTSANPHVSAYSSYTNGTIYFDDKYVNQEYTFTAVSDTVIIKVSGHLSSSVGTYCIKIVEL